MTKEKQLRQQLIDVGRILYEARLVAARSGNVSARVDDKKFLITAHATALGFLKENDLIAVDLEGRPLDTSSSLSINPERSRRVDAQKKPSFEITLHSKIYQDIPSAGAIVHSHSPLTIGYFNVQDKLIHLTYESKIFLGEVGVVTQHSPNILDVNPVIEALKLNNIVVLRNHGVLAIADNALDAYFLIDSLEETIKALMAAKAFGAPRPLEKEAAAKGNTSYESYAMFSPQHIARIVEIVNGDDVMRQRGKATSMTMRLAVKMKETGQVYNFHFKDGVIVNTENNEDADFVITADKDIWRAVFENRIDPFVATTQKKMQLDGDFGRISKWYSPCSRIFELWKQVKVQ